jgi:hypothetical protein
MGVHTTNLDFSAKSAGILGDTELMMPFIEALAEGCERDFQLLASRFGAVDRFGPANRIQVVLDASTAFGGNWLGQNDGFKTDGTSEIDLAGSSPLYTSLTFDDVVDLLAALFVAELAEILLDLRQQSQPTLGRGNSDGEAYSRVAAQELHPRGYAQIARDRPGGDLSQKGIRPTSAWLNRPNPVAREDWITQPEHSDADPVSIGCGILFLYFLHTQLGHSWSAIVNALGETLAGTYTALGETGSGFDRFRDLLDAHFPVPQVPTSPDAPTYDFDRDDLFPLLDRRHRSVSFAYGPPGGPVPATHPGALLGEGFADVRPTPLCPSARYFYETVAFQGTNSVQATAHGFGDPVFTWSIAGTEVPDAYASPIELRVPAAGWDDDIQRPWANTPRTADVTVTAQVYATDPSTLYLTVRRDIATPSVVIIDIDLELIERALANEPLLQSTGLVVITKQTQWEDRFREDRDRCAKELRDLIDRDTHRRHIVLLKTLPDPPHYVQDAIAVVAQLQAEQETLRRVDPDLAANLDEILAPGDV